MCPCKSKYLRRADSVSVVQAGPTSQSHLGQGRICYIQRHMGLFQLVRPLMERTNSHANQFNEQVAHQISTWLIMRI